MRNAGAEFFFFSEKKKKGIERQAAGMVALDKNSGGIWKLTPKNHLCVELLSTPLVRVMLFWPCFSSDQV
jgi:hypothetical protein